MVINFVSLAGGDFTPCPNGHLSRTEYKPVIKPVVAQGLCELRQVVTFLYNPVGEIFFIIILPLILVPEIPNKVVRIFLA